MWHKQINRPSSDQLTFLEATPSAMARLLWTSIICKKASYGLKCSPYQLASLVGCGQVKLVVALITGLGHFRKHLHALGIVNDREDC